MAATTGIEWADATWNPWRGCHKVSQGCAKCYMFRDQKRYGRDPNAVVRSAPATFNAPLAWARSGKVAEGARIFTCSWSDWFIEEADEWRAEAWEIVRQTPQFNYLILTKRPERISAHLPPNWGAGYPNVWLGVSTERQAEADERVPYLLSIPAAVRFVSGEPLLGPIGLAEAIASSVNGIHEPLTYHLDWVITGGESDPTNPRPCDLDWVRDLRDQCLFVNTAFFHKQHGGSRKVGGAWGGRELDGRTWDEFPTLETK